MNFKFAKTLLMGTVLSFGLMACGDDSSSSTAPQTPGAGDPIVIPTQKDANIQFDNLNKTVAGSIVVFSGTVSINFDDPTSENIDNLRITDISFQVGYNDNGTIKNSLANVEHKTIDFANSARNNVNLTEMGIKVNLKDEGFTNCGNYVLIIKVSANDGVKDYSSNDQVAFTRAESFCAAINSSSSAAPVKEEIAMEAVTVLNVATGGATAAFSFDTGVAGATGDVVFSKAEGVSMTSATGYTFVPLASSSDYSADDGYWPEEMNQRAVAYLSDFKFNALGLKNTITDLIENSSQIYIAAAPGYDKTTGKGIYPFAITKYTEGNNKNYTLTIKYYKVK